MRILMLLHKHYPLEDPRTRREAVALVGGGHEVDVVCLRGADEPPEEIVEGVRVRRLPVRRHRGAHPIGYVIEYLHFLLFALPYVLWLQLRHRYDVVHVHNPPDVLILAGWIPRWLGARLLFDISDSVPELYTSRFEVDPDHPLIRVLRAVERAAIGLSDVMITVHDTYREMYERAGVPREKMFILFNAADDGVFHADVEPTDAYPDQFLVLYHGSVFERYGVDLLLEAFGEAAEAMPEARLSIIGDGDLMPRLRELREQLGLGDRVELAGRRPLADVAAAVARADLCVVPNRRDRFVDGILPTKLMEYSTMGRPAIVARTATVERYFPETSVRYFEPGDRDGLTAALRELYADADARERLARETAEVARHEGLAWAEQRRRFLEFYAGLVPSRSGR